MIIMLQQSCRLSSKIKVASEFDKPDLVEMPPGFT